MRCVTVSLGKLSRHAMHVFDCLSKAVETDLSQTFLSGPHRGVDDLEEELAGPGVEDEDGPVDGLGGQVTLKGLEVERGYIISLYH